jgi:hypothetical protein
MSEATKEARRLRRALKKNRASGWRNGTVIRFRRTWHNDDRPGLSVRNPRSYTYAAVWIEATQRWYITGKGAADAREFDTQRLLSYLNAPETSDVRIATAWERVR